jgi:diadenosine tetraphosphate (Ap4A) HIT family hydrolase
MANNISSTKIQHLNATMRKFGAPDTVIHQFQYWSILLRPAQATLGALVLAAHEPARAFSELSQASFTELHQITKQMESALTKAFAYDKLNYLMLMMVDPDVHFHVIPRYAQAKQFNNIEFLDQGWPGPPNLGQSNDTDKATNHLIMEHLSSCWAHE